MRMPFPVGLGTSLVAAGLAFASGAARADVIYNVTMNTQALRGQPGPFTIDFQLTDGSGTGDRNNTLIVRNVSFGAGGAALPSFPFLPFTPGADPASSLSGQVRITDSGFDEFAQDFIPGSALSFQVDLTTNREANPALSDLFTFAILQSQANVPTLNPDGSDTFLEAAITRSGVAITTAGSSSQFPGGFNIAAPQAVLAPQAVGVPEPATLPLLLVGAPVVALFGYSRRRRAAARPDGWGTDREHRPGAA